MRMSLSIFVLCFLLVGLVTADGTDESLVLENDNLELKISKSTGEILEINDKLNGKKFELNDRVFDIFLGTNNTPDTLGEFTPENCTITDVAIKDNSVSFTFVRDLVSIDLSYKLDPSDCFALKKIRLSYAGSERYNVSRIHMFDFGLSPKPSEAIPYHGFTISNSLGRIDDGQEKPKANNSTAFFLRYKDEGIFTALSCDYVLMDKSAESGNYRSIYWPGFIFSPDEDFESEYGIIGVYHRKGVFHEPYQPREKLRDFLYPSVDIRLDRGEIEGIRAAVDKFIKPGVYSFIVNGWAMGLPSLIEDGNDVELYKNAIDTLIKIPQIDALHFIHGFCGLSKEFREQGLDMEVKPNRYADEVFQYARQKGIGLSPFIAVSNNVPLRSKQILYKDRQLLSMAPDGKRREKGLALSKQYMDFIYETISELKEKYPHIKGQTYDFLHIYADYDPNRGYLAGRYSFYPQYYNMRQLNRRLRAKFPGLMLRGQIGWRELGPWFAENMTFVHNSRDPGATVHRNFLDFHIGAQFANNLRLACWFTNNCKMFPRHKMNSFIVANGSSFRAWDHGSWQYCILSRIATSVGFGMMNNLPDEQSGEKFRQEDLEFLNKWIEWQKAHKDYYLKENELFGEPRPTGVDGYAYGNGKDSVLFLCNPTFRTHIVAVPVNEEIHLPQHGNYTVKELYPEERYRFGIYDGAFRYGSLFVVHVPAQTVMVFEVKPDDPMQALLMGVSGNLDQSEKGFVISGLKGGIGSKRLLGVRLPAGYKGSDEIRIDGKKVKSKRIENYLLANINFSGESYHREIRNWKAVRDGDRIKIRASVYVPQVCKTLLEKQKLAVSEQYDAKSWYDRTAWLGWSRFIIHVPIEPTGFEIDDLKGDKYKQLQDSFKVTAKLNGEPIDLHSNMMGRNLQAQRWSGYFIDASDRIKYGRENELEINLPLINEQQFHGLYIPNLSRQNTDVFRVMDPPDSLELVEFLEAADAFISPPQISGRGPRQRVYLKLFITSKSHEYMDMSDVTVVAGRLGRIFVTGNDPRWLSDTEPVNQSKVLLDSKPICINLAIDGDKATQIQLGTGSAISLEDVLKQWRGKNDVYNPKAMDLDWPEMDATISVELSAPFEKKLAVRNGI